MRTGTRLRGDYYGASYTGIVRDVRRHHGDSSIIVATVDLDDPIEGPGGTRESLALHLRATDRFDRFVGWGTGAFDARIVPADSGRQGDT